MKQKINKKHFYKQIYDIDDKIIGIMTSKGRIYNNCNEYIGRIKKTPLYLWIMLWFVSWILLLTIIYMIFHHPNNKIEVVQNLGNYNWTQLVELDLFNQNNKNTQKILFPGINGKYEFVVKPIKNSNVFKYTIKFDEENEKKIPLKYKLKKNNEYIKGNEDTWININEMKEIKNPINNKDDNYVLEWKWEEDNDTDVGIGKSNSKYKILIQIKLGE